MTARSPHEGHRVSTPLELLAAGVPAMFEARMPNSAAIGGYVVMRLAVVAQWLRASRADPARRTTARRYAAGITLLQVGWVAMPFVPGPWILKFLLFAALELAVPVWAERAGPTTWHPHHIAERYGLLTLIVLGESILAATTAVLRRWAPGWPCRSTRSPITPRSVRWGPAQPSRSRFPSFCCASGPCTTDLSTARHG
jgi:hypothetical protein